MPLFTKKKYLSDARRFYPQTGSENRFFKFALVSASLETSRLRERYEVRTAIAHLLNPKIFAMQY